MRGEPRRAAPAARDSRSTRGRSGTDRSVSPRALHGKRSTVRGSGSVGAGGRTTDRRARGGVAGRVRVARAAAAVGSPRPGATGGSPCPRRSASHRSSGSIVTAFCPIVRCAFIWCRSVRADIGLLVRADASVAHCPLSNRAHGHGVADLRSLLLAGLRVGVGTDSVVSVGTLDLLSEARAAAALADLDANGALALCTISAARALGMDGEVGSLRAGKWGDCTVIRPLPSSAGLEPAARVLDSGPKDVVATYVGGKDVHRVERMV